MMICNLNSTEASVQFPQVQSNIQTYIQLVLVEIDCQRSQASLHLTLFENGYSATCKHASKKNHFPWQLNWLFWMPFSYDITSCWSQNSEHAQFCEAWNLIKKFMKGFLRLKRNKIQSRMNFWHLIIKNYKN